LQPKLPVVIVDHLPQGWEAGDPSNEAQASAHNTI